MVGKTILMASTDLSEAPIDLNAYLSRIEYAGDLSPSIRGLEQLHLAHALHIPFENLDVLLGRPIRLDLQRLQEKLVLSKRGGYCFEQNALFAAVLERLGFSVTRLAARARLGASRILPRTHMLLQVDAEGTSWIADVGFGTGGLLMPIPLKEGETASQFAWKYRLQKEGYLWILQALDKGTWLDLYAFTLEPQYPIDYEVANHYVSTHPESRFTQTLVAQFPRADAWSWLRNYEFIVRRAEGDTIRTLSGDEELLEVLSQTFGLTFPEETKFSIKVPL
jgi:N-hydroxyarylamine O-acetyltransferase